MPLIALWTSNPAAVGEFTIEQVVSAAGDGNLKDASTCSKELREYFSQITSDKLSSYIEQCLSSRFEDSGMVLQDLVNELGRRLDYKVANGRYRGVTTSVGFDGLWLSPEEHSIITEVKTTDTYRISLDTVAGYRGKLMENKEINGSSSILIVVGRQDTEELEAQVRGSRHAWDIRMISAEALIKLVKLKENSDDDETGRKIRSVLMPVEYTRLDRLVDVMFTAATDVEPIISQEVEDGEQDIPVRSSKIRADGVWGFTDTALLQEKREQIVATIAQRIGLSMIKKSRALYWTSGHDRRIACTISKRYSKRPTYPYWYAYHPQWDEFLAEATEGLLVLGCMDLPFAFAVIAHPIAGRGWPRRARRMAWSGAMARRRAVSRMERTSA